MDSNMNKIELPMVTTPTAKEVAAQAKATKVAAQLAKDEAAKAAQLAKDEVAAQEQAAKVAARVEFLNECKTLGKQIATYNTLANKTPIEVAECNLALQILKARLTDVTLFELLAFSGPKYFECNDRNGLASQLMLTPKGTGNLCNGVDHYPVKLSSVNYCIHGITKALKVSNDLTDLKPSTSDFYKVRETLTDRTVLTNKGTHTVNRFGTATKISDLNSLAASESRNLSRMVRLAKSDRKEAIKAK